MKLSELTPCVRCGGSIAPVFYRVTVEQHFIDPKATNQVLGINLYFGGDALPLAEAMAPDAEGATKQLTAKTGLVCGGCFASRPGAAVFAILDTSEEE